jgi:hypothetical protein
MTGMKRYAICMGNYILINGKKLHIPFPKLLISRRKWTDPMKRKEARQAVMAKSLFQESTPQAFLRLLSPVL